MRSTPDTPCFASLARSRSPLSQYGLLRPFSLLLPGYPPPQHTRDDIYHRLLLNACASRKSRRTFRPPTSSPVTKSCLQRFASSLVIKPHNFVLRPNRHLFAAFVLSLFCHRTVGLSSARLLFRVSALTRAAKLRRRSYKTPLSVSLLVASSAGFIQSKTPIFRASKPRRFNLRLHVALPLLVSQQFPRQLFTRHHSPEELKLPP